MSTQPKDSISDNLHARFDEECDRWLLCVGDPDPSSSAIEAVATLHCQTVEDAARIVSNICHLFSTEPQAGLLTEAERRVGEVLLDRIEASLGMCEPGTEDEDEWHQGNLFMADWFRKILARDAKLREDGMVLVRREDAENIRAVLAVYALQFPECLHAGASRRVVASIDTATESLETPAFADLRGTMGDSATGGKDAVEFVRGLRGHDSEEA